MTPERHARIRALFLEAAKLPVSERDAYVAKHSDDAETRAEVAKLLAHHAAETLAGRGAELLGVSAETAPKGVVPLVSAAPSVEAVPRRPSPQDAKPHPSPALPASIEFTAGQVIGGRYRVVTLLGRGGMGAVYRADDLALNQPVAIKFLEPRFADRRDWVDRFRNEVRLARRVTHPNVCRVFDIGQAEGRTYLTMELVDGEDMATLVRRVGRLASEKAIDVARQICTGLAAAHGAGVLHRDLKPANILLDKRGRVVLTDFGIAMAAGDAAPGELRAGTPAYMSPEQITGVSVDARSDVYSLGLVLYELFTGRPAFQADSIEAFVQLHQMATPALLVELVPDVDPGVESLVSRCLSKNPDERPQSALIVAADLPGVDVLSVAQSAHQTPPPTLVAEASGSAFRLRRPGLVAALAIALCVALPLLRQGANMPWDRPDAKSPLVLADRAARILERLGGPSKPHAIGYGTRAQVAETLVAFGVGNDVARSVALADDELPFWFRAASNPLVPQQAETLLFENARVSLADPTPLSPDQGLVILNQAGSPVFVKTGPSTSEPADASSHATRLVESLELDGFSAQPNVDSAVQVLGARPCSRHTAQAGGPSDFDILTCGASDGGRLIAALKPIAADNIPAARVPISRANIVASALRLFFIAILTVSLPLAWRNVATGRADIAGAAKTGAILGAMQMAAWLVGTSHSTNFFAELGQLSFAVVRAIGAGALLVILYLGLEPVARRHWPHLLVGWTRLLRFRRGDRVLAEHVLIGVALGCFWAAAVACDWTIARHMGWTQDSPYQASIAGDRLLGGGPAMAACLHLAARSLAEGLLFAAMLAFARAVVRRPVVAAMILAVALIPVVVPRGAYPTTAWLVSGALGIGVGVWAMARIGLLCVVVGTTTAAILGTTPIGFGSAVWFQGQSLLTLALVLGAVLCCWGATRHTERRRKTVSAAAR